MATTVYPKARQRMLDELLGALKAVLVKNTYTYNAAHDFLDDVTAGHRVATATLASVTTTDGVLDAADFSFTGVTGTVSEEANAIILYVDTGVESTSPIYAYVDNYTPNPVYLTPNPTTINVTIDAAGLFTLS